MLYLKINKPLLLISLTLPYLPLTGAPKHNAEIPAKTYPAGHPHKKSQPELNRWERLQGWFVSLAQGETKAEEWKQNKINNKVIAKVNKKAKKRSEQRKKANTEHQKAPHKLERAKWVSNHTQQPTKI